LATHERLAKTAGKFCTPPLGIFFYFWNLLHLTGNLGQHLTDDENIK
jgi:hypothetical protein